MGKATVTLRPGDTKETITHERVIPEGEETPAAGYGMDAYDYMASLTESDWRDHIVYIYRKFPPPANGAKRSYIAKVMHSFDDDWLKTNFGGGVYHYVLKKGSQRIKEGDSDDIPGQPKNPDEVSTASNQSDLVQTVKMLLEKNGSGSTNAAAELNAIAFKNALEIQRASMPAPMSMGDLTTALKNLNEINGGGGRPVASETPDWLKQVFTALIPAGIALITKVLEPKDSLATLGELSKAITLFKSAGGESAAPDPVSTFMANGPQWLTGVGNLLGELRKAEELKVAQRTATASLPPGVAAVPPERVNVNARQATPPPAEVPRDATGEPSADFVWAHVVDMCRNGDDGVFAYNFLDQLDPRSMNTLRGMNLTLEQLKIYIGSGEIHPILKEQLVGLPNYSKFIAEFYMALMGNKVPAAA